MLQWSRGMPPSINFRFLFFIKHIDAQISVLEGGYGAKKAVPSSSGRAAGGKVLFKFDVNLLPQNR